MYSTTSDPQTVKHCEWCGQELPPKRKRFCNKKCGGAWRTANYTVPVVVICKGCGVEFSPKKYDRSDFHSRECAFEYRNKLKVERAERLEQERRSSLPPCEICGQPVSRKGAKTCGKEECKKERDRRTSRESNAARKVLKPRKCKCCGKVFTPKYGDFRKSLCGSEECKKKNSRIHKAKVGKTFGARARLVLQKLYGNQWREHYESINRRKVLERDGWRCQLCGCKLKDTKTWHERQATVDHIVPLARGGDHKYTNVQAACMMCNSKKGDKAVGQLILIG